MIYILFLLYKNVNKIGNIFYFLKKTKKIKTGCK